MPRTSNDIPTLDLFFFEENITMLFRTQQGQMLLTASSYEITLTGIHLMDVVAAMHGRIFTLESLFVSRHDMIEVV